VAKTLLNSRDKYIYLFFFHLKSTNSFCSPPLRTPRQSLTASIHLSGSPLRSFFIKEKRQQSPSCSPSISSTTSCSNSRDQVLRPLNLQNYIGVDLYFLIKLDLLFGINPKKPWRKKIIL